MNRVFYKNYIESYFLQGSKELEKYLETTVKEQMKAYEAQIKVVLFLHKRSSHFRKGLTRISAEGENKKLRCFAS